MQISSAFAALSLGALDFKTKKHIQFAFMAIACDIKMPLVLHAGLMTIFAWTLFTSSEAAPNGSNISTPVTPVRRKSNICPCVATEGREGTCYEFVNEPEKLCNERPCKASYECTNEDRATHLCLQRSMEVHRLFPVDTGKCSTKYEQLNFRIPYGIFEKSKDKPKIESAVLIEDLELLEPGVCNI